MLDKNQINTLTDFRHKLHQHPEVSGAEINTAKMVVDFIQPFKPDHIYTQLSGNAVAAVYDGQNIGGATLLFRCELDALPILETSNIGYKSVCDNVAHSCGHDGHMSIIASLAMSLHHQRPTSGRVILIFQPAEETGKGAKPLVEALKLNQLVPEYSFALHNMPAMEMHEVSIKSGFFNCASVGMKIELIGKTSHASHPENGLNPAEPLSKLLNEVKNINDEFKQHPEFSLITISHARLGEESFGISAGHATIMLTIRSESDKLLKKILNQLDVFVQKTVSEYGLGYDIEYDEAFDASINNAEACDIIRSACADENLKLKELDTAWRPSEDFGQYSQFSKSAMFMLGSGVDHAYLHNPDFNFPDELIVTGHNMFTRIIKNILG